MSETNQGDSSTTALVSPEYAEYVDRLRQNTIIKRLAAGLATVPLGQLADADGSPKWNFIQGANEKFRATEKLNAANPAYTPDAGPRAIGTIATALLAERKAMRDSFASLIETDDDDAVTETIKRIQGGENVIAVVEEIRARSRVQSDEKIAEVVAEIRARKQGVTGQGEAQILGG